MNRRTLLSAGPLAAVLAACSPKTAASSAPEGTLQRIVDEAGVPALGGMVVTADAIPFLDVAGVRRLDAPERVTTDDLWHLGSNTKAMTATVYARLVEAGRARWGATVPELFPDLKPDPAWSKTTVEQLMNHTAGLVDGKVIGVSWLMSARGDKASPRDQRSVLAGKAFAAPPPGQPGTFAYSNMGYMLVGAAIERIVGAPWEEAIAEQLFKPLGMASAGFGAPTGAQPWGHRGLPMGIGGLIPMQPGPAADNPAAMGPAGTVHASLGDYAKFVRLFLTGGGELLKPETVARLTTPPTGGDYALGWGVATGGPWARGPRLAHEGSNTMWHAVAVIAPARGVAIVTTANVFNPGKDSGPRRLAEQLQKRFAPA
jgi:D-alanyl-D-alanine carboxypeptidase